MMGRQSGQLSMMVMDLTELIPNNHLLRRISQAISFDFIYEILEPYYPSNGRPSVDPVSMFKMLLVGYLYGIKSERRLVQEIQLNMRIDGSAALNLQIKFQTTPHSAKHGCANGMKVTCFSRSFRRLFDAV